MLAKETVVAVPSSVSRVVSHSTFLPTSTSIAASPNLEHGMIARNGNTQKARPCDSVGRWYWEWRVLECAELLPLRPLKHSIVRFHALCGIASEMRLGSPVVLLGAVALWWSQRILNENIDVKSCDEGVAAGSRLPGNFLSSW
jgi:hypothetical protein